MAKAGDIVWVTYAVNTSDDYFGPHVFAKEPSDEELESFWREEYPQEFEDEEDLDDEEEQIRRRPGSWWKNSSTLTVHIEECELQ